MIDTSLRSIFSSSGVNLYPRPSTCLQAMRYLAMKHEQSLTSDAGGLQFFRIKSGIRDKKLLRTTVSNSYQNKGLVLILIRSCVTLAVLNASYLGFSAELILANGTMYTEAGPTISALGIVQRDNIHRTGIRGSWGRVIVATFLKVTLFQQCNERTSSNELFSRDP